LDLAAQVLGNGETGRLFKRLVYKDQIATDAFAFQNNNEIAGQFTILSTAKPGVDLKKIETAANEELQTFLKNGPTEEELRVAKTQISGNYARIVERIGGFGGKSDLLASCQTFLGDPECYKRYLERVRAATPATVKKAAVEWLSDGDYILDVTPIPDDLQAGPKLDRAHPPAEGKAEAATIPPMQKRTLSNGLKI